MTSDQALYSLASAVIVALLALAGAWLKSKNDAKATSGDHAMQMIEELREQHRELKTEFADIRAVNARLLQINQRLDGELHDERELNKDLVEFVKLVIHWMATGANKPYPVASWRIQAILQAAEEAMEDSDRKAAQTPEDEVSWDGNPPTQGDHHERE